MTRRELLKTACAAGLAVAARAQNTDAQKRGREVIDQTIAALGGRAFLTMQDRLEEGRAYSFYRENLSGLSIARLYTRYIDPPQPVPQDFYGVEERQVYGKKQESSVLFDKNGDGFEVTFRGARPMPDPTVVRHRAGVLTNILYILRQRLDEPGLGFEDKGKDVLENQEVRVVECFDNSNRTITIYLSAGSKLPVMQKFMRFDRMYKERIPEVTRFSKYKDAGSGVMWPLAVQRERDGEKMYQMFSDKVTVNNKFDATVFALPHGIEMLKKENS